MSPHAPDVPPAIAADAPWSFGERRVRKDLRLRELIWALGGPARYWSAGARELGRTITALEFERGWIHAPRWFPVGPHLETSLRYYQIYAWGKYGRIFRDRDVELLHALPEPVDDPEGALVVGGSANHWHLLNDCLPRLAFAKLRPELRRRTLLVAADLPPPQRAVLDYFLERHGGGAPVRHLREGYHRLARTIVPGRLRPAAVAAIYRTVLDVATDPNDHGPERLFVLRDHARSRLLVNQSEVRVALEPLGFVALDPGTLPFPAQAAWFRRARHVVAVHGAAMANLYFAPRGCRVLELHGGDEQRFFRDQARADDHEHTPYRATRVGVGDHFTVDAERLAAFVRAWIRDASGARPEFGKRRDGA